MSKPLFILTLINLKLKIDHVHLKVSNLEKSLQFYQSIMGFKIVGKREESKTVFLSDNYRDPTSFLIALTEIKDDLKYRNNQRAKRLYHFAILLPERKFLAGFLKHIQNNLNPDYYVGMADHAVSESIYLHDPDFNGVEIYRDRLPSEWKWIGKTVNMVTEPLNVKDLLNESTADNDKGWNEIPPKTSIGHVHLHVSNLYNSKRFYSEILGLNLTASFPGAYFFSANKYHHHIATNTWLGENTSFSEDIDNKPGLDHYAINLQSQNDLLLLKNRFIEFKIKVDDEKLIEYDNQSSSFYAYDLDGTKIQFLNI